MKDKELKYKIRYLTKLKKGLKVGSQTRRNLNRQIRELKRELEGIYKDMSPEKKDLIEKIYKARPRYKKIMDLRKFTVKQLQYHYDTKIKPKEG